MRTPRNTTIQELDGNQGESINFWIQLRGWRITDRVAQDGRGSTLHVVFKYIIYLYLSLSMRNLFLHHATIHAVRTMRLSEAHGVGILSITGASTEKPLQSPDTFYVSITFQWVSL